VCGGGLAGPLAPKVRRRSDGCASAWRQLVRWIPRRVARAGGHGGPNLRASVDYDRMESGCRVCNGESQAARREILNGLELPCCCPRGAVRTLVPNRTPHVLFAGGDLPKDEALPWMVHRFSLATIFYATNGPESWRIVAGWLQKGLHECLWYGVNCTGVEEDAVLHCKDDQGKLNQVSSTIRKVTEIESLDLSGNGIRGSLPDEVSLLRTANIKSILMQSNSLSGSIPSGIGALTALKSLSLSQNNLNGSIPLTIGRLSNLHLLQLDQTCV
jgi:hypothetical protein